MQVRLIIPLLTLIRRLPSTTMIPLRTRVKIGTLEDAASSVMYSQGHQ